MSFRRVIWIVLDSVGIGEMPDADSLWRRGQRYARQHRRASGRCICPICAGWASANIKPFNRTGAATVARWARSGSCALASPGKDTTTGHWEMAGIHLEKPFPLFPHGFPPEVMDEFERRIGRSTLGNKAASGTEIIKELGEEHVRTGSPIVYTSADSVFQVAAHEEVIPLFELYKICETAREILRGPYEVGRVIARPFDRRRRELSRARRIGTTTPCRRPKACCSTSSPKRGVDVFGVGKIFDVFLGRGIREYEKTKNNADGMAKTLAAMDQVERGLIFVNLVDFDQLYGHRNDVEGYARALEEVDALAAVSRIEAPRRTIWRFSPRTTAAIPPLPPPTTAANTCRCSPTGKACPGWRKFGPARDAVGYRPDRGR